MYEHSQIALLKHTCRSPHCPDCGKRINGDKVFGLNLENRIQFGFHGSTELQMLTFTLDHEAFIENDPLLGFETVCVNWSNVVKRLMTTLSPILKSKRYFKIWEFHDSGWAHIHLLLDCPFFDPKTISHVWPYGRRPDVEPASVANRAYYVTKSLKRPEDWPLPQWILDRPKRFRGYDFSNGFPKVPKSDRTISHRRRSSAPRAPSRTLGEILESCGKSGDVVLEDPVTQYPVQRIGQISDFQSIREEWGFADDVGRIELTLDETEALLSAEMPQKFK